MRTLNCVVNDEAYSSTRRRGADLGCALTRVTVKEKRGEKRRGGERRGEERREGRGREEGMDIVLDYACMWKRFFELGLSDSVNDEICWVEVGGTVVPS